MMQWNTLRRPFSLGALLFISWVPVACANNSPQPFADKTPINEFIEEMVRNHQFDAEALQQMFDKARLQPGILEAIARPAESKPWREYRPLFLTPERIRGGVFFMNEHQAVLARAVETYGVPPQIITAIIGVETRYGKQTGNHLVLDALSTLAFAYPPRSNFFRSELRHYLVMTRDEGLNPLEQRGSYAGAMGIPQFISSSFRSYAVDFDGDGKRDLWNNVADAIGSVGNYFRRHKWRSYEPIATRVQVQGDKYKPFLDGNIFPRYDAADFRNMGVIFADDVPEDIRGSLIVLNPDTNPEFWVVWHNFYVITRYNQSTLYGMAVYQLSREIVAAR